MRSKVIAILCSDLHLSHRPPIARSAELNWYDTMERQLNQLRSLQREHKGCPIICAGDIFDKWNSPPELINFAIQKLPRMYSIPGQHDLPNHSYDNIKRSAYWTLVEADVLEDVSTWPQWGISPGLVASGFAWGSKVTPLGNKIDKTQTKDCIYLAVVHSYIWIKGHCYPGAPAESRALRTRNSLKGYNAALYGDNHSGFLIGDESHCPILNCGTFMRRKIDEIDYKPMVGLLMYDGSIRRHYLDCSEDKFIDVGEIANLADHALDATDFLRELAGLGKSIVDFADAVKHFCKRHKVSEAVESIILEAMEK